MKKLDRVNGLKKRQKVKRNNHLKRYEEKQNILVLGDGDFSFTYGLGVHCNDVVLAMHH